MSVTLAAKSNLFDETLEETLVEQDGVSLCLLINRRARSVRVIDFRSGASKNKKREVMRQAYELGLERVYALVEREEASAWSRVGFKKEGTVPGFYKRGDAYVVGAAVEPPEELQESGVHRIARRRQPEAADAVYQQARRTSKEWEGLSRPNVKIKVASDREFERALGSARGAQALERFGRDTKRYQFLASARGWSSICFTVESQECFNNALIQLWSEPRTPRDAQFAGASLEKLCDELLAQEIVGCFAMTPADDVAQASVFLQAGFRRTGLLEQHLLVGNRRVDAFLWSRKLAFPSEG